MEETTIGLGFNSRRGGITTAGGGRATTAFVSASVKDLKDDHKNINNSNTSSSISNRDNHLDGGNESTINYYAPAVSSTTSSMNNQVIAGVNNGGFTSDPSANVMYMQQQQYDRQQQIQPSIPPPHHPSTISQTLHSYSHIEPQLHSNLPMVPTTTYPQPSSYNAQRVESSHSFPPPIIAMQQPAPIIPNPYFTSTINHQQQYSLPSFQPPPGLPPGAVPSFLPPPNNNAVQPAAVIPHLLPHPAVAPFMPAYIPSQQPLQHEQEQEQQQQQQQLDSIEKARALAMQFHQQNAQGIINDTSIPTNINYLQQRQTHFQKEQRKLQTFQLKNLEYVMKHEEKELRKHVDCMNQMTAYEEKQQIQLQLRMQQQRQRQLQLEQRKQQRDQVGMLNDGGGGIGTKEQRYAERVRKRQHVDHPSSKNGKNASSNNNPKKLRTSLYLSNLPIDGSTSERTLQSLFCLYGRLDRVTMYRHRSTGELKGDGLIVFGRDAAEEYRSKNGGDEDGGSGVDLVEAVCTQMNVAELPCGTVIVVQPADMDYKKKSNDNGEQIHQQVKNGGNQQHSIESMNTESYNANLTSTFGAGNVAPILSGGSKGLEDETLKKEDEDDDDDLDDFFASLE